MYIGMKITVHLYTVSQKNCATFIFTETLANVSRFLADRTNGRAYATVLRLSSSVVVCNIMYCG